MIVRRSVKHAVGDFLPDVHPSEILDNVLIRSVSPSSHPAIVKLNGDGMYFRADYSPSVSMGTLGATRQTELSGTVVTLVQE